MRKSIYNRIFAFSLTAALALTSVFTGSVPVSAKKAPKLSKKKLSVTVGKTAKLTVKNANKKVKWSTSNKKVAKISKTSGKKKSTAVIKGVKKGSAKITAKVGSKKLTCKVTVKKAVSNVKSIAVDKLDNNCLIVTLKKKAALNLGDIKLQTKRFNAGKYNRTAQVKAITSADQKVYRIYTDESIGAGAYVKLSIGKDVSESQNKPDFVANSSLTPANLTSLLRKDELYRSDDDDDGYTYFLNGIGNCSYKVTEGTLPAGLTLDGKKGVIKGIPTTVGSSAVTIQATDEMGRSATITRTFSVYDEKTITADPIVEEVRLDDYVDKRLAYAAKNPPSPDEKVYYQSIDVNPVGGSRLNGDSGYKFELTASDTAGADLSTNYTVDGQVKQREASSTELCLPFAITEGTHTFNIHVTDAKDATIVADIPVTVNVVRYFNVSGTVTEEGGKQVSGDKILFIPVSAVIRSQFVHGRYSVDTTDLKDDALKAEIEYENDYLGSWRSYGSSIENDTNVWVFNQADCTARAGHSSTETVPGKALGTYSAEAAPGEYIVKIYSEADDIYYETTSHVTVGAADTASNLVLPTRLYTVMGTATYANGTPVAKEKIYFEAVQNQFASSSGFKVETSDTGQFVASLPTGTYTAYVRDDKGKRLYFTTNIEVNGDVNMTTPFALAVSKSTVNGTVTVGTNPLPKDQTIYFLTSDKNSANSNDVNVKILDDKGSYSVTLFDGTYYVKTYYNGKLILLGTITVAGQPVTQNLAYVTHKVIGTVRVNGNRLYRGTVYLFKNESSTDTNSADCISIYTDNDGSYSVDLPDGTYYAKYEMDDDYYISLGTVTVAGQDVSQDLQNPGYEVYTVSGTVKVNGEALSNSTVYLFKDKDATDSYDAYASLSTNSDGKYSIDLSNGTYYAKYYRYETSAWVSLGTITVASQNVTQNLSYSVADEIGTPQTVSESGAKVSLKTEGTYVKIELSGDGDYKLKATTSNSVYQVAYEIYTDKYSLEKSSSIYLFEDGENYLGTSNLYGMSKGTYYVKLTAQDEKGNAKSADINFSYAKDE